MRAQKLIEDIKEAIENSNVNSSTAAGALLGDILSWIIEYENEALVHFGAIDHNSDQNYREMPDLPGEYLDI